MREPKLVGLCVLCEIPMCSAKVKPPKGAWYDRHLGRRLCKSCYGVHRRRGTLDRFPRLTRSDQDTFDEWQLIKSSGLTRREAAERIGTTVSALDHTRRRMAHKQGQTVRTFDPARRSIA